MTAYLCGGRFFELKTVQKLDKLEIAKPCIEAFDEGYNTEWSTELTVSQAYDEYLKAWMLLHYLRRALSLSDGEECGFMFNMSIGYDLDGIRSDKIDGFIDKLKNADSDTSFEMYKSVLKERLPNGIFSANSCHVDVIKENIDNISSSVSDSITLSTMHGCPPDEIEAICKYLLQEKGLNTYAKLNPTLLGYEFVSEILRQTGFGYIELKKESFENDLQYDDAVKMISRLKTTASGCQREFGIKLSNTLPVVNTSGILPGDEMYMSGKSLFPLTINLASKIASSLKGEIEISYSGGVNIRNAIDILKSGIRPITLVTDLLKPGGYLRLKQIAEEIEKGLTEGQCNKIDFEYLAELADRSVKDCNFEKDEKSVSTKINKNLPLFDCALAPCIESCPIHQDIPQYIKLIEEQRYEEAYRLIISKNPLPNVTGCICDRKCILKCTRLFYDDPLLIRDLKYVAADRGFVQYINSIPSRGKSRGVKVAIIGAGPTGLSAGYFLSRVGFDVKIFDKKKMPGGTVRYIIPKFRISQDAIDRDVELIRSSGVSFNMDFNGHFSIDELKNEGYKYIYIAIGSGRSKRLNILNSGGVMYDAIDLLAQYNRDEDSVNLGECVAVIGGGNSAMDGARAAIRVKGVKRVYIIYRRTKEYMPADREESDNAIADGVIFKYLLLPVEYSNGQKLICQKMRLGEFDESGRRKPVPLEGQLEEITVDSIISAIGEHVDTDILEENSIEFRNDLRDSDSKERFETNIENVFIGGDAYRGPSTVVEAIADGRAVSDLIMSKEGIEQPDVSEVLDYKPEIEKIVAKRGEIRDSVGKIGSEQLARNEADRCLHCGLVCNRCVEVCPNRANVAIKIKDGFSDTFQILHLDGLCNECGNCETFCPYEGGKPYRDKFTVFWSETDFNSSENDGFVLTDNNDLILRLGAKIERLAFDNNGYINVEKFNHVSDLNKERYQGVVSVINEVLQEHRYLLKCVL